ncbi:tail fiber protein [Schlegelella sp. S2-27]|uniref:Tail fiber protein n=1 Tax=Caldimonas mangrovi TaxID=2944811 RepID=A0ABT0YMQ4_9BURK|nr:tail fiber protein [Caldimonas mangrovi]MCM5680006.1 tail fiber protein [Caldimonas mangrovi]
MSEPFIGEIRMVGFNFAPVGWAQCQGQLVPIAQNQALFALLGTMYGGDGQVTFGLPDLRGRSPVGMGQGPRLSNIVQGALAGTENVTLTLNNLPMHNHPTSVQVAGTATEPANTPSASNNALGASSGGPGSANIWSTQLNGPVEMAGVQSGVAGGGQPVGMRNPYIGINFVIAMEGIFPSRP